MAPADQNEQIEKRMRALIRDHGLPMPDEVQHGKRCVRFLWHDLKVAVVVDLDDLDAIAIEERFDQETLTMS